MKTYIVPIILSFLIIAGCSSTKSTADYDDVYYSPKNEEVVQTDQSTNPDYYVQSENPSATMDDYEAGDYVSYQDEPVSADSESVQSPDGTTNITNNYYSGSPYDYSYAARLSRFYSPYMGFGYYSPCYVGYYYDPWYDPYWYSPSFYFGMNWGWGSFGWGYPYYSYPYYGYGYPYNNYWYGYNSGYWNGYWNGYYAGNYYDYGPGNNYYYGHRESRGGGGNSPVTVASRYGVTPLISRAGNYETGSRGYKNGTIRHESENGAARNSAISAGNQTRTVESAKQNTSMQKQNGNVLTKNQSNSLDRSNSIVSDTKVNKNEVLNKPQNEAGKTIQSQSKPRYIYTKPAGNNNQFSQGKTVIHEGTSREYNKPAQTQRYSKPAQYSNGNDFSTRKRESNTQVYSKPQSNYNNSYTKPSRYNTGTRYSQPSNSSRSTYSPPSRSNSRSYSQPSRTTRSYSPPSNNSRSYSTPSRSSSRSYSTPSRSSGSSPSRSSSGSSGGSRSSSSSRGGRR